MLTYLIWNHKNTYKNICIAGLFPLSVNEIKCLNYDEFFKSQNEVLTFENFSKKEWGLEKNISKHFNLLKKELDFEKFENIEKYDIIYYDAFAYHAQPELWTQKYMQKCYECCFLEVFGLVTVLKEV